jgi:hypothetical protein
MFARHVTQKKFEVLSTDFLPPPQDISNLTCLCGNWRFKSLSNGPTSSGVKFYLYSSVMHFQLNHA